MNLLNLKINKVEEHTKVRKYLELKGMSFFTYTPKSLKPYTLIVRGLLETYDVNDLQGFIDERELDIRVTKIVKLRGDRWIIQLTNDSDVQ